MTSAPATLAFILYKYFPYGGLQRDLVRIARACQQLGFAIRVYTLEWQGPVPEGFAVVTVPARGWSSHRRNERFSRWIDQHCHQHPVALRVGFNKMPGLDVYYAADGCYEGRIEDLYGWFYRLGARYRHFAAYERAVFGTASHTHILMISDVQKPVFQRIYHTPDSRMTLLPPGIARDRCAPANSAALRAEFRAEFNLSDSERLLLMVGSGFRTKGVDRSIEALAALPPALRSNTRLIVIGQDKPGSYIARARQLGVAEQLTILSGRDDIPRFMQGADLLIHPARHENTGTVLLEAVAAGLPVLVTDVCGYAHFIAEAGAGQVLPSPFTVAALQQALATMLSADAGQRQAWRTSALNFARTADIYSMPERAAATIAACIEQRGAH